MKKIIQSIFLSFILLSTALYATSKVKPLDQVVAIVNDEVITQSQLDKAVITAKQELQATNTPVPKPNALEKQVLNQLIDRRIELQMAKRFGIEVTQADLNKAIASVAKRNHASVHQLKAMVESNGVSWPDYRKQIKDQLIIQKVLAQAVGSRIQITDQEIKNVMSSPEYASKNISEYHVADILIALPDEPSSTQLHQAEQKANEILVELKKGKNFKELAAANSNSGTALSGGDLGWHPLEELPTVFANKLTSMKPGDVAGPIRTGNGLHVIKLIAVKSKENKHYMTKTNVRHILIKVKVPSESAEAKKQIESIRNQLLHGASFATLAKKYSQDPGSASKGGSLGWVPPGVLVPPFEKAMNSLKIDTISQPVKTSYGWHIIEVLGRKKVDDTADFQKNEIRKMIYQRRFQEEAQNWVERMKDASYIHILLNNSND